MGRPKRHVSSKGVWTRALLVWERISVEFAIRVFKIYKSGKAFKKKTRANEGLLFYLEKKTYIKWSNKK